MMQSIFALQDALLKAQDARQRYEEACIVCIVVAVCFGFFAGYLIAWGFGP